MAAVRIPARWVACILLGDFLAALYLVDVLPLWPAVVSVLALMVLAVVVLRAAAPLDGGEDQ